MGIRFKRSLGFISPRAIWLRPRKALRCSILVVFLAVHCCSSLRCRGKTAKLLETSPIQIALCVLILIDAGIVVTEILLDLHAMRSKKKKHSMLLYRDTWTAKSNMGSGSKGLMAPYEPHQAFVKQYVTTV